MSTTSSQLLALIFLAAFAGSSGSKAAAQTGKAVGQQHMSLPFTTSALKELRLIDQYDGASDIEKMGTAVSEGDLATAMMNTEDLARSRGEIVRGYRWAK